AHDVHARLLRDLLLEGPLGDFLVRRHRDRLVGDARHGGELRSRDDRTAAADRGALAAAATATAAAAQTVGSGAARGRGHEERQRQDTDKSLHWFAPSRALFVVWNLVSHSLVIGDQTG